MRKKLITGGIYCYGSNPEETGIVVVIAEDEKNILFHNTGSYMRFDESQRDVIVEKINKQIPKHVWHNLLQFVLINKELAVSNIHGYLGKVPEEMLSRLIGVANDSRYQWNKIGV